MNGAKSMCWWAFQAHVKLCRPLSALLKLTKVRGRSAIADASYNALLNGTT